MAILENLYITGNHAYNGGGVGVFRLVGPTLNNLIIENNTAYIHGGGIWHFNAKSSISSPGRLHRFAQSPKKCSFHGFIET